VETETQSAKCDCPPLLPRARKIFAQPDNLAGKSHFSQTEPAILLPFCQWHIKTHVSYVPPITSSKTEPPKDPAAVNLGQQLRQKRRALCLWQYELAERLGVTVGAIVSWEKGRTFPQAGNLKKVQEFLKVDMESANRDYL